MSCTSIIGDVIRHYALCQNCGYSFNQPHSWIQKGSIFICTLCGMTTNIRPPIVVEGFVSETVVAALPPSNDDEYLQE